MPAPYSRSIRFRGDIHHAASPEEYTSLCFRAKLSCEGQSIMHPEDPWEWEEIPEPQEET